MEMNNQDQPADANQSEQAKAPQAAPADGPEPVIADTSEPAPQQEQPVVHGPQAADFKVTPVLQKGEQ